jgi:serine/threonine protein kinase
VNRWRLIKHSFRQLPAEWLDIDTRNMVGNGAYGEVYEARVVGGPLKGLRVVAKRAKVKRAKEADGSSAQRYLEVEAYINDVLMALCPEIAPRYLGICNKKGREWLVWEFAGTETLEDILLRCAAEDSLKPLAIALRIENFDGGVNSVQNLATEVAVQLLTCCKALEESGIAHRDVKPNNLLVRDGRLCLIDLGSAAAMGFTSRTGFDENKACWTTAYAPPELFIDVARWAVYDVYSVALILLRMVFPPLWDGGDFESFSGAYQAAGYDLDAWLRQVRELARLKALKGALYAA